MRRRVFLGWASSRAVALGVAGVGLPTLVSACGDDGAGRSGGATGGDATTTTEAAAAKEARAIVGDVVDFALHSDEWAGAFGFVTMAVRHGVVDGADVWYVRTDASDRNYAEEELVFVPRLAPLAGEGLSGVAYVFDDGLDAQPTIFSTEPGRDDYTPAWTLHRVTWSAGPRELRAEAEVRDAEANGAVTVERTGTVVNGGMVKWSSGEMAVDTAREAYLGEGQLLEPVDTAARRATFKLSQCYPGGRYFVLDHSVATRSSSGGGPPRRCGGRGRCRRGRRRASAARAAPRRDA